jgi:hypothetical protein
MITIVIAMGAHISGIWITTWTYIVFGDSILFRHRFDELATRYETDDERKAWTGFSGSCVSVYQSTLKSFPWNKAGMCGSHAIIFPMVVA